VATNCREPFTPDFATGVNDFLVIEGYIHVGQKAVTTISLSRVAPLLSHSQLAEKDASIQIEDKDGYLFPLFEKNDGLYKSDSLDLDILSEYRLLVTTEGGHAYASDFTKVKIAPAIDSLHWRWESEGITIYVNSHDEAQNTHYYKWDYTETWEVNADYRSQVEYKNDRLEYRNVLEALQMYRCWRSQQSEKLQFATTTQFETDHIQYPVVTFPHYSERTAVRYSILVEQRALSKEEFDYLDIIQKNSTVTGSLFDPMPSEIRGNIKSLHKPEETVIGFIGAYTLETLRLFVTSAEFNTGPSAKCESSLVKLEDYSAAFGAGGLYTPIDSAGRAAPKYCMDCRIRVGPSVKPDFW
jgi:Domain of unknown function (DUF4249)